MKTIYFMNIGDGRGHYDKIQEYGKKNGLAIPAGITLYKGWYYPEWFTKDTFLCEGSFTRGTAEQLKEYGIDELLRAMEFSQDKGFIFYHDAAKGDMLMVRDRISKLSDYHAIIIN